MTPRDAITEKQIITMESDNFPPDPGKWSIVNNGDSVSLHPPSGNKGFIEIPKGQFNTLVDWYMTEQRCPVEEK